MPRESEKILFEIYRERKYNQRYEVLYYTELDDETRDYWINRALQGETYLSGFIGEDGKERAKGAIGALMERLNAGEELAAERAREELAGVLVA